MGTKRHPVTKKTKALVLKMMLAGKRKPFIAQKLGISVQTLINRYPKTLAKAERLRQEKLGVKPIVADTSGAYEGLTFAKHGIVVPANCPFSREKLAPIASLIQGFDVNGIPYKRGRAPLFGKKEIANALGKKAHFGTPWEADIEEWNRLVAIKKSIAKGNWSCELPDWERHLREGGSLVPKNVLDSLNKKLAAIAVRCFDRLRLADVPGTPTLEESGAPWSRTLVEVIFGCYDTATKARMIKEIFLLVPKKNSKTTGGALIMLLLMVFNDRPRGQALMTAPVKDVAEIAFDAISGAINLDPYLSRRFLVKPHVKTVLDRQTEAELSVIAYDYKALTGQKVFAALVDELHVIAKMPKASNSLRQIRGGMLPFPEAILIFITTQSEEAPSGVFLSELNSARDIRDGKRKNARMLPILYEFPESMQKDPNRPCFDPKNWHMVTPNLGKSITIDALIENMEDAKSKGESELRAWASQHLNIEIGVALRSDSWVGANVWEKGANPEITLDFICDVCDVVEIGIDGGGLDDLLGVTFTGRHAETGAWLTWSKAWAHSVVLERNVMHEELFRDFENFGDMTIVDLISDGIEELVELSLKVEKAGLLDKFGLDPSGSGIIMSALMDAGFEADRMVGISQGWRLNGAIKTTETALSDGKLFHAGQKMMNWCVGNAKVEPRGNAILITKAASGAGKIDPLMALFNSVHLIAANPKPRRKKFQMFVFGGKGKATAA